MKYPILKLLAPLTLIALFIVWLAYMVIQHNLDRPVTLPETMDLDPQGRLLWSIEKGSNLNKVNARLQDQRIIAYSSLLTAYATLFDLTSIQAGEYWIDPTDTPLTLLDKFNRGQVVLYKITFPEGWTFNQWIQHLAEIPQFSPISSTDKSDLLEALEADIDHPEGWFFPDTYSYSSNNTVFDILNQAHRRMRSQLNRAWQSRASDLPYKTAYEALIMASIIEKETGLAEERGAIAGVFVRRLLKGMRLQTDPTVIYGMGDRYQGNIRRRDLKQHTPYNTYRIDGLPPTPIAMPSAAAIEAALHPESGSSLYFVARGDGGHHFSDNMKDHLEAVRYFQIEQRAQEYQSAP